MLEVNRRSFSKKQPCVKQIKAIIDHAVHEIYGNNAHVQLQGSVGKGTGIEKVSDLDFFVMLAKDISQVTRAERITLMNKILASNSYSYSASLREHRILLIPPHDNSLPSVDIVFERFKIVKARDEPNSNLSESHEAQIVTKFLKFLPRPSPGPHSLLGGYTNLNRPGSQLERFVLLVEQDLASNGNRQKDLTGSKGVSIILQTCLEMP